LLSEVEKYSNLIIFHTASKAVGSAALRLGFAVANETISRAVKAVKSPYNVNSFSQAAGAVIFKNKEYLQNRQKTIVKNRETLYNGLMELGNALEDFTPIESVANFVFVRTSQAEKIFAYLKSKSIVVRLMGSYLRITAGTGQEVEQVLNSIKEYFEVTA
jgi:histidinol-phosphate aminotransferase